MIETGFKLAFRWYENQFEQDRFKMGKKGECGEYKSDEYIIMPTNEFLPFQLTRGSIPSDEIDLRIVCIDTGTETILTDDFPCLVAKFELQTVGSLDYIIFKGNDDCSILMTEGLYEAIFTDDTNTWYSELFKVEDFTDAETYYRLWQEGGLREYDDGDLRIYQ